MDNFQRFLNSIYQNISTAIQSIEDITPNVKNTSLKEELATQNSNYLVLQKECEVIAKAEAIDIKDNDWFEKARLFTTIKMTTTFDKTTRNITEKLLIGTIMGIITCYKDQCDYESVSIELMELSKKLLNLEEENFNKLKKYLCVKD